jgi:hypothetical protein
LTIYLTLTSTLEPRYTSIVWWATVGHRGQPQMADIPYPETGLSQETRETMYPDTYSDKYNKVFKQFIDDIFRPNHVPKPEQPDHSILLDELELLHEAHTTVGGQQNRFNASVIRAAINVIRDL